MCFVKQNSVKTAILDQKGQVCGLGLYLSLEVSRVYPTKRFGFDKRANFDGKTFS